MIVILASAWRIMPICDCHNQPTNPSVFQECTFQAPWLPQFTLVLSMQENRACIVGMLNSSKNLIKAFIKLGALLSSN